MSEKQHKVVHRGKLRLRQLHEHRMPAVSEIKAPFHHRTECVKTEVIENDVTLLFSQSIPERQEGIAMASLSPLMLTVGFRNSVQCFVQVRRCVRNAVQGPGIALVLDLHLDLGCSETPLQTSNATKCGVYTQGNAAYGPPIPFSSPGFHRLAVVTGSHAFERILVLDQTANDRLCQNFGAVPIVVPIRMRSIAVNGAPIAANHFGNTVRVTKTCDDPESLGLNSFRSGRRKMRDPLDGVGRNLRGCRVREGQQPELRVLVSTPASRLQMAIEY